VCKTSEPLGSDYFFYPNHSVTVFDMIGFFMLVKRGGSSFSFYCVIATREGRSVEKDKKILPARTSTQEIDNSQIVSIKLTGCLLPGEAIVERRRQGAPPQSVRIESETGAHSVKKPPDEEAHKPFKTSEIYSAPFVRPLEWLRGFFPVSSPNKPVSQVAATEAVSSDVKVLCTKLAEAVAELRESETWASEGIDRLETLIFQMEEANRQVKKNLKEQERLMMLLAGRVSPGPPPIPGTKPSLLESDEDDPEGTWSFIPRPAVLVALCAIGLLVVLGVFTNLPSRVADFAEARISALQRSFSSSSDEQSAGVAPIETEVPAYSENPGAQTDPQESKPRSSAAKKSRMMKPSSGAVPVKM